MVMDFIILISITAGLLLVVLVALIRTADNASKAILDEMDKTKEEK